MPNWVRAFSSCCLWWAFIVSLKIELIFGHFICTFVNSKFQHATFIQLQLWIYLTTASVGINWMNVFFSQFILMLTGWYRYYYAHKFKVEYDSDRVHFLQNHCMKMHHITHVVCQPPHVQCEKYAVKICRSIESGTFE